MVIERNTSEIIIRVPSFVNIEGLQRMLDYLTYQEATAKNEASAEDIDNLVKEVKKGRWAARKKLLSNV